MSWASEVTADAPTIWWRFEETSGQHLDETANNHDSTAVTVTGQGTADPDAGWAGVGKGDDFNGTSDLVSTPDHVDYFPSGTTAYSVEVVAEADTADSTFRRLASHETTADGWSLAVINVNPDFGWRAERKASSGLVILNSGTVPTLGQTYHVVATYDGTDVRLYVDGALAAGPTAMSASMADPASDLYVGRRSFDATRFFDGRIFEFAFYNGTALSLTRIQAHYNARNDAGAPAGPTVVRSNLQRV